MNIKENIRIAIFSIKSNLMRSLLTMLGIIIGVASVIAVITVGNGGRDYIVGMIRDMGSSAISITVNAAYSDISNSDYITDDDINAIKSLDNVQYVSPMVMTLGSLSVDANDKNAIGFIVGGNSDLRYVMNGDCIYGRYFNKTEVEAGRSVCIIDSTSAMQLFGKKNVVGEFVSFNYNDVSVSYRYDELVRRRQRKDAGKYEFSYRRCSGDECHDNGSVYRSHSNNGRRGSIRYRLYYGKG